MGLGKWIVGGLGWAMFGPLGGILGIISHQEWKDSLKKQLSREKHNRGIKDRGPVSL